MSKYLGLDLSTQSLSAVVIDTEKGGIIYENSINFGQDLPEYKCSSGFLENDDPLVKHSDPLMWADAVDLLFTRMKEDGFDFSSIDGISGSGQQHGTVYLNSKFIQPGLWNWDNGIASAVKLMLSRKTAPIWMDSSTSVECEEISQSAGGEQYVRETSGSPAVERFSGPQIRKFYKDSPDSYNETKVIHLVSSFLCSILCGKSVAIDQGDASGMNLLNLSSLEWDDKLLEATAPDLKSKLPSPASPDSIAGSIAGYFIEKYGFSAGTPVIACSGDNPNSIVGMGASEAGTAVVSLGTSDTFFAAMESCGSGSDSSGHIFCNPAGGFMALICFKNGSLAREKVKNDTGLSWDEFDNISHEKTIPGNNGKTMLPFFVPEITPLILEPEVKYNADDYSAFELARAVVEAQAVNMKIHSSWIKMDLKKIRITGGGSKGNGTCQVFADVFQTKVERFSVSNSAALGAAMRAAHATEDISWAELNQLFCEKSVTDSFYPDIETAEAYEKTSAEFTLLLKE